MKINKFNLTILIAVIIGLCNFVFIYNVPSFFRVFCTYVFLILIPGYLFLSILKIKLENKWNQFVYIIGLGLTFTIFGGLIINWTFEYILNSKPFYFTPLLISYNLLLLILLIINFFKSSGIDFQISFNVKTFKSGLLFIIPSIFPILSVLGSIALNNNSYSFIPTLNYLLIASFIILISFLYKRINHNIFPYSILMISISVLLSAWLRSWYISAPDTGVEYTIFTIIKNYHLWKISLYYQAFNSCLSVSILPVVFFIFTRINDQLVFKFMIPLLFSFTPLIVYLISKKYLNSLYSFLAALFFISQPAFTVWLTTPIRQEVAYLFFGLSILALLNTEIDIQKKKILFILINFSMIVSHYSTTYIAVGIYFLTFFTIYFLKLFNKRVHFKKLQNLDFSNGFLSFGMIMTVLIATYLWYGQLTYGFDNLAGIVNNSFSHLQETFNLQTHTGGRTLADQFNISNSSGNPIQDLNSYKLELDQRSKININNYNFYPQKLTSSYTMSFVSPESLSTSLPSFITSKIPTIRNLFINLGKLITVLGIIYLILFKRKFDTDFLVLCIVSLIVLLSFIILPFVSISYDVVRLYQQLLFMLSPAAVLGVLLTINKLKNHFKNGILVIFFILYFIFVTRVIYQFTGGYDLSMNFNNFGTEYDTYYTHTQELASADWLSKNGVKNTVIYADFSGMIRLELTDLYTRYKYALDEDIYPSLIIRNSYVYADFGNTVKNVTFEPYGGVILEYVYPSQFLAENKNLVYNNGESKIYK